MKRASLFVLVPAAILFVSCTLPTIDVIRSNAVNAGFTVAKDMSRDQDVLVTAGGVRIDLPESLEKDGALRAARGWTYHVMGVSEDGKLIAGYAENKRGFTLGGVTVDPGTTIGVYWVVVRQGRHDLVVSGARVIGALDPSASHRPPRKARSWISQLRLFLRGSFDAYLVMVEKDGVHFDSVNNVYLVTGTDQDGVAAVATIGLSGSVGINPALAAPFTPTGLVVWASTDTTLSLLWSASDGATSYQVYRDTDPAGPFSTKVFDGAATGFTDVGLGAGTTYYYEVRATNAGGSSALSAVVEGTTSGGGST